MRGLAFASLLVLLATGARPASASPIQFGSDPKKGLVDLELGQTVLPASTEASRLGWLGGATGGYSPAFYAYCLELLNYLRSPQTVAISSTSMLIPVLPNRTADSTAKAAWLFNRSAPLGRAGDNDDVTGLQVATWEALYGSPDGAAQNSSQLSSSTGIIATRAVSYLSQIYSGGAGAGVSTGTWLDAPADSGKDQMLVTLPEPSSLILGATGLLGLTRMLYRRRRRQG